MAGAKKDLDQKLAPGGGKYQSKYFSKRHQPRQEISRVLKYLIFFINFIFVLCGFVCLGLGIYLYANEFRPVLEAVDFFLNPAILLIAGGVVIGAISFAGCMGALRENVFMLKMFSLSLFCCYIILVIIAFVIFILFYSDTSTGISIQTLLATAVEKYHQNDNYRDFMDYLQIQLKCCGATSQGYKDWAKNVQYNCSSANKLPERCGVPYSCCVKQHQALNFAGSSSASGVSSQGVASGQYHGRNDAAAFPAGARTAAGAFAPRPRTVYTASNTPSQCWRNAQKQSLTDVQNRVYTDGCLHPLQKAFEGHAVIIGAMVGAIIIPVCLSVTFSNILAKQIDRQRFLLDKEARRDDRRRRRARQRFRDPFATIFTPPRRRNRENPYYAAVGDDLGAPDINVSKETIDQPQGIIHI